MKIKTTRFGTIKISRDKIINMPYGILGFPDKRQFIILQHKENSPFYWFQSIDDPDLAFVLTSPFLFKPDYQIDTSNILKEMQWDEEKEKSCLELYVVVNIPKDAPSRMTANLIGPILINNRTRQAIQIVIPNSPYSHKFSLIGKN